MDIFDILKRFDLINLIAIGLVWWNLHSEMETRFTKIEQDMAIMKQEIAIIKTTLILKNIMPSDLAVKGDK